MTQTAEHVENIATRLIDRHVQASLGNRRAFDYADKHYSYHDLAALVNRAGNLLKSLGVTPGARVLLLLPASPAYLASMIGAMKIGAVPVIVSQPDDAAAVTACVNASAPAIAVIHADYLLKAGPALGALGADKTIVVGNAPTGHPSFVEGMRSQSSSLIAEPAVPDAPGLTIAGDAPPVSLSHGELQALVSGRNEGRAVLGGLAATLQALANAETAQLF